MIPYILEPAPASVVPLGGCRGKLGLARVKGQAFEPGGCPRAWVRWQSPAPRSEDKRGSPSGGLSSCRLLLPGRKGHAT